MTLLQDAIRWFLPEDERFFGYILDAAASAESAAVHFVALADAAGRDDQLVLVERIHLDAQDAHAADRSMSDALDHTFVTPMDREDLLELTARILHVADAIASTANHVLVHHMEALPLGSDELARLARRATELVHEAAGLLASRDDDERLRVCCRELSALDHEAEAIYRTRVGDLFASERNAVALIKEKEFLEGCRSAVAGCRKVGNALQGTLIKNN